MAIVNESGGPLLGAPSNEEVGIAYGVGVTANGAPETGTYVGTNVGVG